MDGRTDNMCETSHYFRAVGRPSGSKKEKKTGVINDPLGQTHNPTGSYHYFHSTFVLFCDILKTGDERTDVTCENNDHWDCGSTERIKKNKKDDKSTSSTLSKLAFSRGRLVSLLRLLHRSTQGNRVMSRDSENSCFSDNSIYNSNI